MYSGITKIYYRKSVGHVFTKFYRQKEQFKNFFAVICFPSAAADQSPPIQVDKYQSRLDTEFSPHNGHVDARNM